jgi:hypothetical protein
VILCRNPSFLCKKQEEKVQCFWDNFLGVFNKKQLTGKVDYDIIVKLSLKKRLRKKRKKGQKRQFVHVGTRGIK